MSPLHQPENDQDCSPTPGSYAGRFSGTPSDRLAGFGARSSPSRWRPRGSLANRWRSTSPLPEWMPAANLLVPLAFRVRGREARMLSVRSPAASSGVCCEKTKSKHAKEQETPRTGKARRTHWPGSRGGCRPDCAPQAAVGRWFGPCHGVAMVRKAPPISPDQKV